MGGHISTTPPPVMRSPADIAQIEMLERRLAQSELTVARLDMLCRAAVRFAHQVCPGDEEDTPTEAFVRALQALHQREGLAHQALDELGRLVPPDGDLAYRISRIDLSGLRAAPSASPDCDDAAGDGVPRQGMFGLRAWLRARLRESLLRR